MAHPTSQRKRPANRVGIYDCVIGVSGRKDSRIIVKHLMQNHQVGNPLLITPLDESTRTQV